MNDTEKKLIAREVGARIAQARKESGFLSQRELADMVPVAERSLAGWEIGEVIPYRYMRRLEELLNKPASWLLYGDSGSPTQTVELVAQLNTRIDAIEVKLDEIITNLKKRR